jgi:hypothetical protein
MTNWSTKLHLLLPTIAFESQQISIKRGIFQGDSWSPLWFCLAMNSLSNLLSRTKFGYRIDKNQTLSHLLYMDDLKLYATDKNQLLSLPETTAIFSTSIQMNFDIEKCAILEAKKGKIVASENLNLNLTPLTIPTLETDKTYKYLGKQQLLTQSKDKIKQNLT